MTINDNAQLPASADAGFTNTPAKQSVLAGLGLFAGFAVVMASSCCVVPLTLAALGVGTGMIGNLELLIAWRVPFLAVGVLAIVGGWAMWWRNSEANCASGSSCSSPARSRTALALLSFASIMVVVAGAWDYLEPILLKTMVR